MCSEQNLSLPSGMVRLRWLADKAVRVTHLPPGETHFPVDRPWLKDVLLNQPEYPPDLASLQPVQATDTLTLACEATGFLFREAQAPLFGPNGSIRQEFLIEPEESFYGGGEWFNGFRRTSGKLYLKAQESLSFTQNRQTYSTIPLFFSSRGYAIFLLNSYESLWEIDPQAGVLRLDADGPPLDYLLIYGPEFREILITYTALTGRPPLLPIWAFGLWATGYPQVHQDRVVEHVLEHRRRQVPLDAVILDYHWEAAFHNFQWRQELIPEPARLIRELRKQGVRLGLIFTPFVNADNRSLQKIALYFLVKDIPPGMIFSDDRALPEYRQGLENGYFAHQHANWWFGQGGMLDFTNPEAAEWWNAKLARLYQQGVAFFKNDDGEYLPVDAHSALGMNGREYHNIYGFYYGRAIYNGMQALDKRRPMIYARSVWAGSQRYPALFLGDQKPTFESLQRTLRAGLNMSLLGFAYWTADVFGLDGKTTPETHMRYAQWALLVPVARYFWRPPRIDRTRFPWSHNAEVETNFKLLANLRYQLLPYYYSLAREAQQTGIPIMRPMLLEFDQERRSLQDVEDQAMLGRSLLIAPVVQPRTRTRLVRLPAGVWHDYWSSSSWDGPADVEVPAPLHRLPLLVRGGSILPLGPVLQSIPDQHRFTELELHCWPPYPANGWLYEDDGWSQDYLQGVYAQTIFSADQLGDQLLIQIGASRGHFEGQPLERRIGLVVHRCQAPERVRVNAGLYQNWVYDPAAQSLRINLLCPVASQTRVDIVNQQDVPA
jgi:alpha-glucosidase (family GH31 glycosyl hydrolase)